MPPSRVFYVGQPSEVKHHAAPLQSHLELEIVPADQIQHRAQAGDVAIFFSEHFDRFRQAVQILKERQVATLYQIDGILEWRNAWENRPDEPACPFTMRPVLAHKVACIGASQARVLHAWGNRGKIEVVGIPRFDRIRAQGIRSESLSPKGSDPLWRGRERSEILASPTKGLTPLGIGAQQDPDKFRLLVMTAKVPGFTTEQLERTQKSLLDLKFWIDQEQQTRSTLPHRRLEVQWRLTAGLDRHLQVENHMSDATGIELADQLQAADALITTPSTAMLEGMLLGLPVALLDYHGCPSYVSAAWKIDQAERISQVISELAHPPESKRLYQQTELGDALLLPEDSVGQSATQRMVDLIQAMQATAQAQLTAGQPLKFPDRILEPVASAKVSFQHHSLYPDYPEFQAAAADEPSDSAALSPVELAQARREIKHLRRELAQCQSELSQAHAIFEQIHQHPVAGPIVRLRQKFLDWYARNQAAEGK